MHMVCSTYITCFGQKVPNTFFHCLIFGNNSLISCSPHLHNNVLLFHLRTLLHELFKAVFVLDDENQNLIWSVVYAENFFAADNDWGLKLELSGPCVPYHPNNETQAL
ncbi:hypothetical protein VNO77_40614 [Canavalia gladiata]|uniref:Uncharacterized protein n=1 Tax=Canavalia gladiata TaxID=3824 RepID=A0AAN9JXS4_CANGL